MKRLVVLISGGGSNLQALIEATESGALAAQIVLVISNNTDAYGVVRAQKAGIPTLCLPHQGQKRAQYDEKLAEAVAEAIPDLIVLAGWLRILTPTFLDRFPNKVINLHPALHGQFDGLHAIERAYEAYQRGEIAHSGCMIHHVIPVVDGGEVIAQAIVPILPEDTLETFEARMHRAEHLLIVKAVALSL